MPILSRSLLLAAAGVLAAADPSAAESLIVNRTGTTPLLDGRCGDDEWKGATRLELPAQTSVHLMHDDRSLFVCAKGKANDYTVIDLYIKDEATGHLHNLHASAQLSERVYSNEKWSESEFWNHQNWTAFWVPYAGQTETDDGSRTKFLQGSHREVQVLRRKFSGNDWKLMISISAVNHQGEYGAAFHYPEKGVDSDVSTWAALSFEGDAR